MSVPPIRLTQYQSDAAEATDESALESEHDSDQEQDLDDGTEDESKDTPLLGRRRSNRHLPQQDQDTRQRIHLVNRMSHATGTNNNAASGSNTSSSSSAPSATVNFANAATAAAAAAAAMALMTAADATAAVAAGARAGAGPAAGLRTTGSGSSTNSVTPSTSTTAGASNSAAASEDSSAGGRKSRLKRSQMYEIGVALSKDEGPTTQELEELSRKYQCSIRTVLLCKKRYEQGKLTEEDKDVQKAYVRPVGNFTAIRKVTEKMRSLLGDSRLDHSKPSYTVSDFYWMRKALTADGDISDADALLKRAADLQSEGPQPTKLDLDRERKYLKRADIPIKRVQKL